MSLFSNLKVIKILKSVSSIKKESKNSNTLTLRSLSKGSKALNDLQILTLVSMLKQYPQIERKILLFNSCPSNYITNDTFYNFGIPFNIHIFLRFLERDKEYINEFLSYQSEMEELVYQGDICEATKALDHIDSKFGITLWSIDVRISLMTLNGPDASQNILKSIDEIAKDKSELKHYKSILALKYLSLNSIDSLTESFANTAKEYRSNGQGAYIDTISTIICPINYDPDRDIDNVILFSESISPIDRYVIYKKAFFEYFSYKNDSLYDELYRHFIESAPLHCDDFFWINLRRMINGDISEKLTIKTTQAITFYTQGLYEEAIDICTSEMNLSSSNLGLIDILTKSLTYKYHIEEEQEFQIGITSPLINATVSSICLILASHENSTGVQNTLENLLLKLYGFDFSKAIEPAIYSIYPYFHHDRLYHSTRNLFCTKYIFTPKFCYFSKNNNIPHSYYPLLNTSSPGSMSPSRLARIDVENGLAEKELDIHTLLSKYEYLTKYKDITNSELLFLLSEIYISRNDYEHLLTIIVKDVIKTPRNIIYYPLEKMIAYISSSNNNKGNICATIFGYLYHSTIDHNYKEATSEFLEDYLSTYSLKKPSELITSEYELDELDELSLFFLKKICVPEHMSSLIEITSNRELLVERLKIIQFLSSKELSYDESLSAEENEIVSELLSHKLTAQHEKSKITINTDGIIKLKSNDYKSLLFRYYLLSRKREQVFEEYPHMATDDRKLNDLLENVLFSLHSQIYKDFILNNDFGVVRSLSSEIRHGVLPNQIRSVFEAYNLITIVGSDGNYASNTYWRNYFSTYLHERAVNHIDTNLKWFSKEVDSIIKEVTEWPKVRIVRDANLNHAFHFDFNPHGIKELFEDTCISVDSEENFSDEDIVNFMKNIEAYCWNELQSSFDEINKRLNEYLKPKFSELFEQLKLKISKKFNAVMLDSAVERCEHKLMEEIAYIETWFKKPSYILHEVKFNLIDVIHSSLDCIKAIYEPKALNIEFQKNVDNDFDLIIDSTPSLGLVRALLSIYSNCFTHGINKSNTKIKIFIDNQKESTSIYVKNETTTENINSVVSRDVINTVLNYSVQDKHGKLINEGDTGLYKIYRYLVDSYENFRFDILYDESHFTQRITIL